MRFRMLILYILCAVLVLLIPAFSLLVGVENILLRDSSAYQAITAPGYRQALSAAAGEALARRWPDSAQALADAIPEDGLWMFEWRAVSMLHDHLSGGPYDPIALDLPEMRPAALSQGVAYDELMRQIQDALLSPGQMDAFAQESGGIAGLLRLRPEVRRALPLLCGLLLAMALALLALVWRSRMRIFWVLGSVFMASGLVFGAAFQLARWRGVPERLAMEPPLLRLLASDLLGSLLGFLATAQGAIAVCGIFFMVFYVVYRRVAPELDR